MSVHYRERTCNEDIEILLLRNISAMEFAAVISCLDETGKSGSPQTCTTGVDRTHIL
jgi:hypothetical protein